MIEFVESSWLKKTQLKGEEFRLVDPRSPVEYLKGHIKGAVNLPAVKIFDEESRLLPASRLAKIVGESGIDAGSPVVVYDAIDGQAAAILAWTLEYLGHSDVRVLASLFEKWIEDGNEVYYKPVRPESRAFHARPNSKIRAEYKDLIGDDSVRLVDVRSEEEYAGTDRGEIRPGHIPGAISLPWTRLLGGKNRLILSSEDLKRVVSQVGLNIANHVVTYCRTGPRAAIGYYALKELGFRSVRLYDGSFHEWSQKPELGVERVPIGKI